MSKRKQTISKPSQRFGASQNQKFAGLSALLAHHPPRNSRFPNGPSVGPQVEGTEWLEGACRDLRHIKLADYDVTVDSFSAHVRDEAMNVSYVQSRTEIYRNRTGGGFPNSVVHRENESRKIYVEDPGDRLLVGQFDVFDREESNRKNAGYTGIVHQAHPPRDIYSEQVPAPTVSPPDHRYQKAVLEPPIRRPLEGQHSDRQRVEKQHTNRQKPNKQPSNGRRFMRQHTQRTQPENSRSSRQQPASVQGSRQPKLQPSLTKREDPELDSWKNVLLALEALNIKMTVEENEHVGQAHEIGGLHRQPTSLHLPVFRSRSRQHSRQGRRSGGARDGRSKTPSRSIRCTVAGPYWEWDSQAPNQFVPLRWISEHNQQTLFEHFARLARLSDRLSHEPHLWRLIYRPLRDWMSHRGVYDSDRSEIHSDEMRIVLVGRERTRAMLLQTPYC